MNKKFVYQVGNNKKVMYECYCTNYSRLHTYHAAGNILFLI